MIRLSLRAMWNLGYQATLTLLHPLNLVLIPLRKHAIHPYSVLHVSYMVHVPYHTTRILRSVGMKADYLAKGSSETWNKFDYQSPESRVPMIQALLEVILFWRIVARYQSVHLHFGNTMSLSGWELPILKKLRRVIVIHYRGCEVRNYHRNIRLHPNLNICQDCDYDQYCVSAENLRRVNYVSSFGDAFLVTTPDLKDFAPTALHMPFFSPENIPVTEPEDSLRYPYRPLRILHWTNHPGIEGSDRIRTVIENLRTQGYPLKFVFLKGVNHDAVMREILKADLTIGKMKMGYYANSQIEAMACGVPTITWVRPEFMTEALKNSGFIFSHLDDLEATLRYYLENPGLLEQKRRIARQSILRLHDNVTLAHKYREIYQTGVKTHL